MPEEVDGRPDPDEVGPPPVPEAITDPATPKMGYSNCPKCGHRNGKQFFNVPVPNEKAVWRCSECTNKYEAPTRDTP